MYHHKYHRHCEKLIKKLAKSFYGKGIRIKDLYFIEFFKIAIPKLEPDVIFGFYLAIVMFFFYVKFIFFILNPKSTSNFTF